MAESQTSEPSDFVWWHTPPLSQALSSVSSFSSAFFLHGSNTVLSSQFGPTKGKMHLHLPEDASILHLVIAVNVRVVVIVVLVLVVNDVVVVVVVVVVDVVDVRVLDEYVAEDADFVVVGVGVVVVL